MRRRIALGLVVALAAAAVPLIGQSPTARVSADPRVAAALELVRVWLEGERAYDQIPGVSAAVVYDGEEIVFEVGRDGKATRFTRHNNYYPRVKSTT